LYHLDQPYDRLIVVAIVVASLDMFYSDSLLSKTGPLARVWLAANLDRKLSKAQVLQSDIPQDINAIVSQGQAPMALRLSGQLMLGVVRIYGKKAKYLQDDCHEALLKIRMTFRNTGNHDLPTNAAIGLDLNLPDLLTIDDLFPSMDFTYPLTQQPAIEGPSQDLDEDWTSTLNPQQSTQSRLTPEADILVNDDDLGLDFGNRDDFEDTTVSIEQGRNAPAERGLEDSVLGGEALYKDDDLGLDFGDDADIAQAPADLEMPTMAQDDDPGMMLGDDETAQLRAGSEVPRARQTGSPLSEANSQALRDMDATFNQDHNDTTLSEAAVRQPQRSKKVKQILPDAETVLHNREIKAHADDRSKILKAPSFLPRDPVLLALQNMQRSGDFVANAMNDGASRHWAPELQGLLSFDVVYRSGTGRKRKRDSGIAGLSEEEEEGGAHSPKSPRLDLEDEGVALDAPVEHEPIDETNPALEDMVTGEDDEGIFGVQDENDGIAFDDTTMPLVHPADSGPVSLGTKRAVHLLRDKLGGSSSQNSPKKSVLLQELVPERVTSREEATKMFFEVLVLATKDAVKVEQSDKGIGLPLRIRGKRGLWGAWAEETREEDEDEGIDGMEGARVVEVEA
jgi:cohesin complex subunit SCC1